MLLAYTIWGWAIQRRGVARTALFLYLIPVITGVLSMFFLGESFGVIKVLGALLVLGGVLLARTEIRFQRRARFGKI
jgi:drug/metabolite transporter (DMT)-like permease